MERQDSLGCRKTLQRKVTFWTPRGWRVLRPDSAISEYNLQSSSTFEENWSAGRMLRTFAADLLNKASWMWTRVLWFVGSEEEHAMTRALEGDVARLRQLQGPNGWGLPFAFDTFDLGRMNPSSTAYSITTALALQALLDAGAVDRSDAELVLRWSTEYSSEDFYWYADRASDAIFTVNASIMMGAMAARFLDEAPELFYAEEASTVRERSEATLKATIDAASEGPEWPYRIPKAGLNDLVHQGYILWALEVYRALGYVLPWSQRQLLSSSLASEDLPTVWPKAGLAMLAALQSLSTDESVWGATLARAKGAPRFGARSPQRDAAHVEWARRVCGQTELSGL